MSEISVCYFACYDCETALPVPDRVLESDGFFFNCSFCSRPISLRNIFRNEALEIIESFGCAYGGKEFPTARPAAAKRATADVGNWIHDSVSQAGYPVGGPDDANEHSIVEGSASKWEVESAVGGTMRFEFFSEIRKAVLDGRVTVGDFVVSVDGKRHRVEDYPGTADLFGNQYSKTQIGLREIPEWKPISRGGRRWIERAVYAVLTAGTALGLYLSYPFALEAIRTQRGASLVQDLAEQPAPATLPSARALLAETARLLHAPEIVSLTAHAERLAAGVGKEPRNVELIGALAQTWTEIGWLQRDASYFARAEQLAYYAREISPGTPEYAAARGRALWRAGRSAEAIALLDKAETLPAEGYFVLGQLWNESGDATRAILNLSQAAKKDPTSTTYQLAIVDQYERAGKYAEAAGFLQKAAAANPGNPEFPERLLGVYRKASDFQSIEDVYRARIAAGQDPEANAFALISVLNEQQKLADVARETAVFLARYPRSERAESVRRIDEATNERLHPKPVDPGEDAVRKPRVRRRR